MWVPETKNREAEDEEDADDIIQETTIKPVTDAQTASGHKKCKSLWQKKKLDISLSQYGIPLTFRPRNELQLKGDLHSFTNPENLDNCTMPTVWWNDVKIQQNHLEHFIHTGKRPLTVADLIRLVQQFEETGSFEDRVRTGRPSLRQTRSVRVAAEMETASESAAGTSSARKAGRRLDLPPSSIRNILRGVLNQYPYKLQSCHELLPSDTVERKAFARWVPSKIGQDSYWVFNILGL
ncbi:uncharacterized protein NPIL_168841 [Nephila pilipes]|uniref:Uncharacterized protein n=1 Tax=Nephila pilipes TaxID=299642 RepID=A0A8X6Q1E0_NEPPI|nr:uncharacterized protein NPIL_168841 [Nephila pilipes]